MFDYLAALISVILGMALTHILKGCNRLIQMRASARVYWVQLLWSVNVLVYVLAVWWGMFWWRHLEVWTIEVYFFLTAYAIVLFLLAGTLFPIDAHEGFDYEAYFYANRPWFFGLQIVAFAMDVPETLLKSAEGLRTVPTEYLLLVGCVIGISALGLCTSSRRVHAVLAAVWSVLMLGYLTFSSLARISA